MKYYKVRKYQKGSKYGEPKKAEYDLRKYEANELRHIRDTKLEDLNPSQQVIKQMFIDMTQCKESDQCMARSAEAYKGISKYFNINNGSIRYMQSAPTKNKNLNSNFAYGGSSWTAASNINGQTNKRGFILWGNPKSFGDKYKDISRIDWTSVPVGAVMTQGHYSPHFTKNYTGNEKLLKELKKASGMVNLDRDLPSHTLTFITTTKEGLPIFSDHGKIAIGAKNTMYGKKAWFHPNHFAIMGPRQTEIKYKPLFHEELIDNTKKVVKKVMNVLR